MRGGNDAPKTNVIDTANRVVAMVFPLLGFVGFLLTLLYNNANRPDEIRIQAVEAKQVVLEKENETIKLAIDKFPSEQYFDLKFKTIDDKINDQKTATDDLNKKLERHILKDVK